MTNDLSHEIKPGQSIPLLKALHILTREGKLNQDSRRKLKQVYHLYQFIEPLLKTVETEKERVTLVDHGAGKSYLGFILYDLFFKYLSIDKHVYSIEKRPELIVESQSLAKELGFDQMSFLNMSVEASLLSNELPTTVDMVTALHACDTATDDAITFAIKKAARFIILVPCCQAEVAACLKKNHAREADNTPFFELWRHPHHRREFASHLTNVLRCLQLQAHGYQVTVTELVGWEHAVKNELIIASYKNTPRYAAKKRLLDLLDKIGLESLKMRFFV